MEDAATLSIMTFNITTLHIMPPISTDNNKHNDAQNNVTQCKEILMFTIVSLCVKTFNIITIHIMPPNRPSEYLHAA